MRKLVGMLDFETLGLSIDAPLVAAGAAVIDMNNPVYVELDGYYSKIEFDIDNPALFDKHTLWWWMQQSDEARKCFNPQGAKPIRAVFAELKQAFFDAEEIYSKGADFDLAIAKLKCAKFGIYTPFHYRAARCYRTIEAQNPRIIMPDDKKPHHARQDATNQLMRLHAVVHNLEVPAIVS